MTTFDFDFFVIGGGSGGVRAARIAASLGATVGLCEASSLGGTCVNVGCVPKKLFTYAAEYKSHFEDSAPFGWASTGHVFDWATLMQNKDVEITRLNGIYQRLLENVGVQIHRGRGVLTGPHSVSVNGTTFHCKHILIATGSKIDLPNIKGIEHALTSDDLFRLPTLPKRLIIVGGGYIGVEFASILHNLGVHTQVVHRGSRLLKHFDKQATEHLRSELENRGISFKLNTEVSRIEKTDTGLKIGTNNGPMDSEAVLFATGRSPNTQGLGCDAAGVSCTERGAIIVDDVFRSNTPSIYAVGDVIDRVQLTPTALEEGMRLSRYLFGNGPHPGVLFQDPPTAVFTKPEFATVGMSEETASRQHNITVFTSSFRAMKHTISQRQERSFMKLVVCQNSDRVLGCHMVGDNASEIIQGLAVALKAGATKQQFDETLGIHPTAAEEFVTMRTPRKE